MSCHGDPAHLRGTGPRRRVIATSAKKIDDGLGTLIADMGAQLDDDHGIGLVVE
jgi:hypothetical protein